MSMPKSPSHISSLGADSTKKKSEAAKASEPSKEALSLQADVPVQHFLLADFDFVAKKTATKKTASTKPERQAAMATGTTTSATVKMASKPTTKAAETLTLSTDADYPTPPEYAHLATAAQENAPHSGIKEESTKEKNTKEEIIVTAVDEGTTTMQAIDKKDNAEKEILAEKTTNEEPNTEAISEKNASKAEGQEEGIEEEIIEGIQETLPPTKPAPIADLQEQPEQQEQSSEDKQPSDTLATTEETGLVHNATSSQDKEEKLPSEASAISTAEDRPLNEPKRVRPPTKTREERGLPPLDEHGNEPPTEPEEKGMTLMEHLAELRTRLVRSFIVVGLVFVVCYTFSEQLFAALCQPLIDALPEGSKLIFTALPEAFFVYLQVGLVAAVFVASPYLFYQIWGFISPGLYEEEKKYMVPMALISAIFFLGGASFCFFVVFPYAFTFFVGFASEEIAAMPSLSEYLGFALKLLIAFGLIFEMPLFTFFLARMGVVTAKIMRTGRKYAVLCIFIVAAILTPPDVISQLLMAFPMMLLYELSIGVAAMFGRKKKEENTTDQENTDKNSEGEETTA